MAQPHLPGVLFVLENRAQAIASARAACQHRSTADDARMVVFCDGSLDQQEIHGGIAVTYHPWIPTPGLSRPASARGLIEFTRPVDYIFDSMLTEAISLCQAMAIVANEIAMVRSSGLLIGQTIRVTILNDCEPLLRYLNGTSRLNPQMRRMLAPIIRIISLHARRIQNNMNSRLVIGWIPGHGNTIHGHRRADRLSRNVYRRRDPTMNHDPPVVSLFGMQVGQGILMAAENSPRLMERYLRVRQGALSLLQMEVVWDREAGEQLVGEEIEHFQHLATVTAMDEHGDEEEPDPDQGPFDAVMVVVNGTGDHDGGEWPAEYLCIVM